MPFFERQRKIYYSIIIHDIYSSRAPNPLDFYWVKVHNPDSVTREDLL